jgi:hypothetical protein
MLALFNHCRFILVGFVTLQAQNTVMVNRAAQRFLYACTLKQSWFEEGIPQPKRRPTLPDVLSAEEVWSSSAKSSQVTRKPCLFERCFSARRSLGREWRD